MLSDALPESPVDGHSQQHELLSVSCCCTDEFLDAEESDEDDGEGAYSYNDLAAAFGSGGRSGSDVDQSESASDVEADGSDMDQPEGEAEGRNAGSGSDQGDASAICQLVLNASCRLWHLRHLVASPSCVLHTVHVHCSFTYSCTANSFLVCRF